MPSDKTKNAVTKAEIFDNLGVSCTTVFVGLPAFITHFFNVCRLIGFLPDCSLHKEEALVSHHLVSSHMRAM